jgi:hypothetical protein
MNESKKITMWIEWSEEDRAFLGASWAFRLHDARNYSIFPFNRLDTPWDKISLAANVSKPSRE